MPQQTGRVEGKKALITGAAQGLGAASAHLLARHGAKVALADINHAGVEAVAGRNNAELGAKSAHAFLVDGRDETQGRPVFRCARPASGAMGGAGTKTGLIWSGAM